MQMQVLVQSMELHLNIKKFHLVVQMYYKLYAVFDSEDTSATPLLPQFTVTNVSGTLQEVKQFKVHQVVQMVLLLILQIQLHLLLLMVNHLLQMKLLLVNINCNCNIRNIYCWFKRYYSRFTLDTGQRDNFYDISRLVRKGGKPTPVGKLLIVCDYFAHGTGDFFSVDSYGAIDYKEIPTYTATRVDPEVRTSFWFI